MITAGLLKPDSACIGVTNPVIASATSTSRAVRSMRIRPVAKRSIAMNKIMDKIKISSGIDISKPTLAGC